MEEIKKGLYTAEDIACYVINRCLEKDVDITNLKLQELMYLIQGIYFLMTHKRLIDDDFYTCIFGPRIPTVHDKFPIVITLFEQEEPACISCKAREIINTVIERYAHMEIWKLIDLVKESNAWKYTYEIFGSETCIDFISICDSFTEQFHENGTFCKEE